MWDGNDGMGWWMLFGGFWMVFFWGFVIWGIYAVVSRTHGRSGEPVRDETALETAKRRYARGEISKDEYERLRSDLL